MTVAFQGVETGTGVTCVSAPPSRTTTVVTRIMHPTPDLAA
jgi:hypothetical protein